MKPIIPIKYMAIDEKRDYAFNLLDPSDTIQDVTFTNSPELNVELIEKGDHLVSVWVSNPSGTLNGKYFVTAHVTTVGGRHYDQSVYIYIIKR